MIHAAIVPGSWLGLVVAIEDAAGLLRPVHVESFEVGTTAQSAETGRFAREATPEQIAAAVQRVVSTVANFRADHVVIEWARSKAAKAHELTEAIRSGLAAASIEARTMHAWRLASGGAHHEWAARRCAEGFAGWPAESFSVARTAGAMLLEAIAPTRGAAGEAARSSIQMPAVHVDDRRESPFDAEPVERREFDPLAGGATYATQAEIAQAFPGLTRIADTVTDAAIDAAVFGRSAMKIDAGSVQSPPGTVPGDAQPLHGPASPYPPCLDESVKRSLVTMINETIESIRNHTVGPKDITAGLDPGSAHVSLVVTQGRALSLTLLFAHTFDLGARVPLAKPKIVTRYGKTFEVTTRHSVTQEHVDKLADEILAVLVRLHVDRLVIEHVDSVHVSAERASGASSIATTILRTTWIEREIAVRARLAGIACENVTAATWRAVVAGRSPGKRGGAGAELIPAAIAAGIAGWPAVSDEHERDAAGLCIYPVALAEREARVEAARLVVPKRRDLCGAKAARAPRSRKPRDPAAGPRRASPSDERKAERKRLERAAAGCQCGSGRHRTECPLSTAGRIAAAVRRESEANNGE
jgi:hypothetical protein